MGRKYRVIKCQLGVRVSPALSELEPENPLVNIRGFSFSGTGSMPRKD